MKKVSKKILTSSIDLNFKISISLGHLNLLQIKHGLFENFFILHIFRRCDIIAALITILFISLFLLKLGNSF